MAQQTGLPADQASARVDQVLTAVDDARTKAADAAETARKMDGARRLPHRRLAAGSAVGAYWAAMKGGRHRDEGTMFTDVFGRY